MQFFAVLLRERNRITRLVGMAAIVGGLYGFNVAGETLAGALRGAMTGLVLAGPIIVFQIFWRVGALGLGAAKLSFGVGLLVRIVVWLVIIGLALNFTTVVFEGLDQLPNLFGQEFRERMLFSFLIVVAFNFVLGVNSLLGGRVLLNFLLGRYYQPIEETRVFMFLDIAGSTAIAEKIGDIKFHQFVNQVFADATDPILETKGEIYKYMGDGIIVTWPLSAGTSEAACLICYLDIVDTLRARQATYAQEFGVVPTVRAGLHAGPVVTGEMGRAKQEIVFLGDTVNTAARLETACAEWDVRVLLSGDLMDRLKVPANVSVKTLGSERLRGKAQPIELFTAVREGAAA